LRIAKQWEIEAARERGNQKPEVSAGGISDTVARAERLARQGRLDASTARDLINDLLAASGQQAIDAVTNRVWCDGWMASKKGAVKESSRLKYDQVCRDWITFLNGKADKPLEIIGKTEAVAFRDRLGGAGLAARTVNHTVKLLRGIYGEAVEQGLIGRNPFAGVAGLREEASDSKRKPFTAKEVGVLVKAAKGDWKGLVILAATTGLRLMDAARLQWRSLDLDAGIISIRTAKTGAALTLPIHPEFSGWLAEQPRGIGAAPVFPTLATKGGAGKSGLSMAFKRLMERAKVSAGIARQAKEDGSGRTTSQKSFHSLRHFAATQLAANGVRAEVARQITGHADAEEHANYVTADLDSLRIAVKNIRLTA
jgi:integrase